MKTSVELVGKSPQKGLPFVFFLQFMLYGMGLMVNGQTIPRVPNCADTPLHPMAGKAYTYAVTVAAPYTTPQSYDWYVTDNPGFIAGSALITTNIIPNTKEFIDAGVGYHDPATGTNSITIKWTGKAAQSAKTKPYFLVIHYKGTNGTLCEAMNMKAYKIEPYNAFTLDLTNFNASKNLDLGLNSNLAVEHQLCASDITSVSFDGTKMVYNYGVNELVFKVVAANFTGGWTPTVKVSGLDAKQTIGSIEWSATATFSGTNTFTQNGDSWSPVNKVQAPADNLTEDGEVVYIRVSVKNNDYEGTIDTPVNLAINGVTDDGAEDVHYADCLADGFANDVATQRILARPVITSNTGTPAQSFLP
jgi:hypothetical protein